MSFRAVGTSTQSSSSYECYLKILNIYIVKFWVKTRPGSLRYDLGNVVAMRRLEGRRQD